MRHPRGSLWNKWDLHVHTPASSDYQQANVSALDILKRAEEQELDIIALTDHNSVRGYADLWREIEDLDALIAEVRQAGARIKLIQDGDVTASISAAIRGTNDHLAIGIGGTRQAVLGAAPLAWRRE